MQFLKLYEKQIKDRKTTKKNKCLLIKPCLLLFITIIYLSNIALDPRNFKNKSLFI